MARSTTDTKSLRSAAKNPFGWDVSGLLEDAAAELDAMQATIDVLLFEFGTNEPELLKETIANTRKAKREAYADSAEYIEDLCASMKVLVANAETAAEQLKKRA